MAEVVWLMNSLQFFSDKKLSQMMMGDGEDEGTARSTAGKLRQGRAVRRRMPKPGNEILEVAPNDMYSQTHLVLLLPSRQIPIISLSMKVCLIKRYLNRMTGKVVHCPDLRKISTLNPAIGY
jgi:hypothetical protein